MITDRTHHESLVMKNDGYQQYFRLVTHKFGIWYGVRSTPNGVVPDAGMTRVMQGNKPVGTLRIDNLRRNVWQYGHCILVGNDFAMERVQNKHETLSSQSFN